MFKFNELKHLHLELSSNCQASCPMCSRNIHGGVENPLVNGRTWTLDDYKKIVSVEVLKQITSIGLCGGLGDPLMANDLLDMLRYSQEHNPDLHIHIHTNGSLRSKSWWAELASLGLEHLVVLFAIDGLEDTHSIYRIGTSYNKIIENAEAFINAGGNAEWVYLRFKHNEHQVDEAKRIAQEMGFKSFTMKDTSRFLFEPKFPVYNKDRETIYNLEPSQHSVMKFIDRKIVNNYKEVVRNSTIHCIAKERKEVFIDAQGHLYGCCWIGTIPYQSQDEWASLLPIRKDMLDQHYDMINRFGGYEGISTLNHSIKDILESEPYQTMWDDYWHKNKMIMCTRACGINTNLSRPVDQFTAKEHVNE